MKVISVSILPFYFNKNGVELINCVCLSEKVKPGLFKKEVNKYFLGKGGLSFTLSSLPIKWAYGQSLQKIYL